MTSRIVVGIDGSEPSRAALRVAVEQARLRGGTVDVVHAWMPSDAHAQPKRFRDVGSDAGPQEAAERMLADVLSGVPDDVGVESWLVEGPAVPALLERAHGAELLVVGSRGRGGFEGLPLGSTSQQVASHASCAVLVVRAVRASSSAA